MASSETIQIQSPDQEHGGARKAWETPRVIVAVDARRSEAKGVTGGTDFHSATTTPYS